MDVDWSDLPTELLQLITKKLGCVDMIRFKAVCSSWNQAGKSYISSPYFTPVPQTPLLMLPSGDDDGNEEEKRKDDLRRKKKDLFGDLTPEEKERDIQTRRFLSLAENKYYTLENVFGDIPDPWCVGSSHGWLMIMQGTEKLHLFNPFSRDRIELPVMATLPDGYNWRDTSYYTIPKSHRKHYIVKAVTSSDPSSSKDFAVVIIYSNRLAFCNKGDKTWTAVRSEDYDQIKCIQNLYNQDMYTFAEIYEEIMFHRDHLYTLANNGSVEVWDLNKSPPTAKRTFHFRVQIKINRSLLGDKFFVEDYLVESSGDLLFVRRFIVTSIVQEGKAYKLPDNCPYRTLGFDIYRLCLASKDREKVECLYDRVLFLGGAQSMSLSSRDFPECEGNSIYFTDYNWSGMSTKYICPDKEYDHGGHDIGIYNLKDKAVKQIPCCQVPVPGKWKIDPPPFWIVPNPWSSNWS